MENRNNALHYKMYKSGKSIVYAGLATTAALAGLAFANVNATAVHADTVGTTCPAPNAVEQAKADAATAQNAVNDQQKVVDQAQNNVNSAAKANEGMEKLNNAIQARSAAEAAQKSAASQYNNVDLPAEKAAQQNLGSASKASQKAAQAASGAQQRIDDATNNKLPLYQKQLDHAKDLQKKMDDAKAAWSPVNTDLANKIQERDAYASKVDTPNFEQSKLDELNDEVTSLREVADPLFITYNGAKTAFEEWMNGNTLQDLQDRITNAENYIKGQQKLIDDAKAAHEAYVEADKAYKEAYANSLKSYTAMNDKSAYNNAQALINKIRKDYNIPTDAQLAQLQKTVNDDKGSLNYVTNQAKQNEDYVKATETFPQALKEKNQKLTDDQNKLADLKKQDAKLQDQIDAQKQEIQNLDNQIATAKPEDVGDLAIKRGQAKSKLTELQSKSAKVTQDWRGTKADITQLKTDIHSIEVNKKAIEDSASFKKLQGDIDYWQNKLDADQKLYNDGKANNDAASVLANAQAVLASATNKLNQLKSDAQAAQAKADALQKALDACKDQPSNPGDDNNSGNTGDNTDNNSNNTNNGNGSANNGSANTNNGSATVNGNHGAASLATGNGSQKLVASFAAVKASTNGASAAATAKDSQALPQTGNENSAAVIALGAVSAMFGLGLAAKKREF